MRRLYLILASIIVLGLVSPFTLASAPVINDAKEPQFLFILSAQSGSYDGKMLTLNNVPLAIYFSDRPNRIAGHMSLKKFIKKWNKGADSFKADPPNAVLSVLDEEGNKNIIMEISRLQVKKNSRTFNVRLLSGNPKKILGPTSLFIDYEHVLRSQIPG